MKEKREIKNRWTGAVIHSGEYNTLREAVVYCVAQKISLSGSDLSGSDLSGSNLRGSDLSGSDLSGSNLRGSNLRGSDLSGSNLRGSDLRGSDLRGSDLSGSDLSGSDLSGSDLSGSDLSGSNLRGSDLSGSNLRGSDLRGSDLRGSDLSGSDLSGSNLRGSGKIPVVANIHQEVFRAASSDNALDMATWHTCETTHCRAGWVVWLAGAAGAAMEWCLGTPAAAALIYQASDPRLEKIPDFYADNETALADMKRLAEAEAASVSIALR